MVYHSIQACMLKLNCTITATQAEPTYHVFMAFQGVQLLACVRVPDLRAGQPAGARLGVSAGCTP